MYNKIFTTAAKVSAEENIASSISIVKFIKSEENIASSISIVKFIKFNAL